MKVMVIVKSTPSERGPDPMPGEQSDIEIRPFWSAEEIEAALAR